MRKFVDAQALPLKRLIGWILSNQSRVIVLSESWLHYIQSIAPRAKVTVLPNYVDLPSLDEQVHSCVRMEETMLLFLGTISQNKGIYDLLRAIKIASVAVPELRLTIGGIGETEQAQALASDLGIGDRVYFAGWVTGTAKKELLTRANIFVLPSYNEGLPVSVLEAMSWGIPVIATTAGGIPDLVRNGLDGILIAPGDINALSSAIIELSSNREFRVSAGTSARHRVESDFAADVVLPQLDGLYRAMTDNHPCPHVTR
jgi:glycosyltransferase involved in cell wall biosynthesis